MWNSKESRSWVLEYNKKEEAQQQNERYIYNHGNWYKGDITTYWESRQQVCNEGRYSRIHSDISPEEYSGGVYLSAVGGLISPRSGLGQVQRKLAHFCFDIQREPISNQTLLLIFTLNLCLADSFSVGLVSQARKYLTSSWFVTCNMNQNILNVFNELKEPYFILKLSGK